MGLICWGNPKIGDLCNSALILNEVYIVPSWKVKFSWAVFLVNIMILHENDKGQL